MARNELSKLVEEVILEEIKLGNYKDITFYSKNGECIILVGDFNARTSNKPDFIDTEMNDIKALKL